MSRITEYPAATAFDSGDILIKDGTNGTRIIAVEDAAEALVTMAPSYINLMNDIRSLNGGTEHVQLEQGSFRFPDNAIMWQNNANRCRTRQGTYLQLYRGDVITATNGVLVSCVRVDSDFNKIEIIGEQQYNTSITVEIPGRHLLLLHYDGDSPALTPATAMQNCTLTSAGLAGDIQGLMIEEGATYE